RYYSNNVERIEAAVVLERDPVVLVLPAWESDYQEFKIKRRIELLELQDEMAKKRVVEELKIRQKKTKTKVREGDLYFFFLFDSLFCIAIRRLCWKKLMIL